MQSTNLLAGIIDTEALAAFFVRDTLLGDRVALPFLAANTIGALLLTVNFLANGTPEHEGFLETYSSILFLFSALLMGVSALYSNRLRNDQAHARICRVLAFLGLILLVLYGEEISWGQRFFGWDSVGVFERYNYQKETNLHNFLNPVFNYVYPVIGLSFCLLIYALWFFPSKNRSLLILLAVPHSNQFFVVFFMTYFSFRDGEVFEEFLALFPFLFSLRVFLALRLAVNRART